MSCEDYIVGQQPRFPAEFRIGNTLTDPTSVKFIYTEPDGDPVVLVYGTDIEVVKESTGKYYVDLNLSQSGKWRWRWESTGVVVAAAQSSFKVVAENPIG